MNGEALAGASKLASDLNELAFIAFERTNAEGGGGKKRSKAPVASPVMVANPAALSHARSHRGPLFALYNVS